MNRFLALLLLFLLMPASGSAETETEMIQKVGIEQKLGDQIPLSLPFVDETGKSVRLKDYFQGKPVLLTPVYYQCPMLCTLVLNGLTDALKELKLTAGKEFQIVTFSINPGESPEMAAKKKENYLKEYNREGAAEGWHFLTGSQESITALTEAVGFKYQFVEETGEFAHAASIQILTPEGKIANYFSDVQFDPKDLRLGFVEASDLKIATFTDQLLLLCFHYDPATGKYTFVISNILRVLGTASALVLFLFIGLSLKNDKNLSKKKLEDSLKH